MLRRRLTDETTFTVDGIGFAVQGSARSESNADAVIVADVFVDGQLAETVEQPTAHTKRRYAPFWRYGLANGSHAVRLKIRTPAPDLYLQLERVIVYGTSPKTPPV